MVLRKLKKLIHRAFLLSALTGCLITGYWVRDTLDPLIKTTRQNPVFTTLLKEAMIR